ncbi:T6SS immunity protein Tli4 family protein [Piscinibacter sakaiensis]|nr:T6SS immunity protein Tli4 family protein [Piscinibacter sakaiensis]
MATASADAAPTCLGRFAFLLPEGWVPSGRETTIYFSRVSDAVETLGRPIPGAGPAMRVLRADLPPGEPLLREFALDGVGPAAWFAIGGPTGSNRRLVALAGTPEAGLRMELIATGGREAQAEAGLKQLAAGYRAGARTGFCLERGAIVLAPSRSERTRLSASHPALPGATLRFSTVVTASPRSDGPLADPAADAQAMAGTGSTLTPLSKQERSIAGLRGYDARASLQEPGKPLALSYRFFHAGVAGSATAPEIIVALDGPASARVQLDAAWDRLLDSVRPVPAN